MSEHGAKIGGEISRKYFIPNQIIGFLREAEFAQAGNRQLIRIVVNCFFYVGSFCQAFLTIFFKSPLGH
jgi:hypothetical protein